MLPVLTCTEAVELVLVADDGADQFPNRDLTAGGAAGWVEVMEPVEAVGVLVMAIPGKAEGATVVLLLVDPPNIEDVLLEETVKAGLVVVREGGCVKPAEEVASPKMGLKFCTGGLLSEAVVAAGVALTAKMGLKPDASRGLVVLTDAELLAGAAVAVAGLEAAEEEGVLVWLVNPNRLGPATAGLLLGALDT